MRTFKAMTGSRRLDKLKNEDLKNEINVSSLNGKIR